MDGYIEMLHVLPEVLVQTSSKPPHLVFLVSEPRSPRSRFMVRDTKFSQYPAGVIR
jgi:hypothetical protein